jgi:hypothetical protein
LRDGLPGVPLRLHSGLYSIAPPVLRIDCPVTGILRIVQYTCRADDHAKQVQCEAPANASLATAPKTPSAARWPQRDAMATARVLSGLGYCHLSQFEKPPSATRSRPLRATVSAQPMVTLNSDRWRVRHPSPDLRTHSGRLLRRRPPQTNQTNQTTKPKCEPQSAAPPGDGAESA